MTVAARTSLALNPEAPEQNAARWNERARGRAIGLAVMAIVIFGLAIRVWCARVPLFLDEIWSIENLAPLTRFWQVFWGISHDNNHFLNSLWLYFASELTTNEIALRAPSILMGAATIAIMARLGLRHSPAAAVAAAGVTAASCFFVSYSAEARGYAGLALAIAIGFEALETSMARPSSTARFVLAAAAGIGALWHFAMLPAVGAFALICLCEKRRCAGDWRAAIALTVQIMAPALAATLPSLAFAFAGALVVGRVTIGGLRAFDAHDALGGMASAVREAIGAPGLAPAALVLSATAILILVALRLRLVRDDRRIAYGVILLALPAAVFVLQPPNAHVARYYLICALFLILLIAEVFGSLWRRGAWGRLAGMAGLAAIVGGDASQIASLQSPGNLGWPQALSEISRSGALLVGSSFDDRIGRFVSYYNRSHPAITLVPRAHWCESPPQWLIVEAADTDAAPADYDLTAADCRIRFEFVRAFEGAGLSRMGWALYRAR